MQTVWKAVLEPMVVQSIEVPKGARMLSAHSQHEKICVWFLCDSDAPKENRWIAICGTGHQAPLDGIFLGTAQLHGGALQFHVFERQSA